MFRKKGNTVDVLDEMLLLDTYGLPYLPSTNQSVSGYLGDRSDNPVVYLEIGVEEKSPSNTHPSSAGKASDSTKQPQSLEEKIINGEDSKTFRILGRLYFELRKDLVPIASMNFYKLCSGDQGYGEDDGILYHYKGTKLHRIVKDKYFQGGDLLDQEGECSRSIYQGRLFRDENYIFRHTGPGCLSYVNRGPDTNGSLFQITFCAFPDFDERHVVFGCLCEEKSFQTLIEINKYGTDWGEPRAEVRIVDCGIAFSKDL